jgi:hypothetical protein
MFISIVIIIIPILIHHLQCPVLYLILLSINIINYHIYLDF